MAATLIFSMTFSYLTGVFPTAKRPLPQLVLDALYALLLLCTILAVLMVAKTSQEIVAQLLLFLAVFIVWQFR